MNSRTPLPYAEGEAQEIQSRLDTKLDASHLSYRPAAQGTVAYLEGWKAFNLANEVFGFNGWSSEILSFTIDFSDVDANGKISLGMSCMVRVYLRDGTYHDDIGYGSAENQKSKAAAYEKAKKEAVTDGMKRALRMFGNRLGNCAYDKVFLKDIKNIRPNSNNNQVPFIPANYPKPLNQNVIVNNQNDQNNQNITRNVQNSINNPPVLPILQAQVPAQPTTSAITASTTTAYDDSMFDNSMMISEEDFIGSDENFSHLTEAAVMELEESYNIITTSTISTSTTSNANGNVYPLLPNKRK